MACQESDLCDWNWEVRCASTVSDTVSVTDTVQSTLCSTIESNCFEFEFNFVTSLKMNNKSPETKFTNHYVSEMDID